MDLASLTDVINTTTVQGQLVFNLFASLAEFEHELIRERTHAGLASARGRVGGRQRGLSEEAERTFIIAETLYREQQPGVKETAQRLNISKVALYKYLCHLRVVIHACRKPTASNHFIYLLYQTFTRPHFDALPGWAACSWQRVDGLGLQQEKPEGDVWFSTCSKVKCSNQRGP